MSDIDQKNSVIFIPDISGFTKFVNDTEISHSQHIIQELLEVLLDANSIDLTVSEIEGDAILFYKLGDVPKLSDIADQIKKMFIKFHEHLLIIERDRVCHCGACITAINLTLKFMTHSGKITESQIKDHKKLIGKDVIIAHRLLKNNIDSDEYSLFTDKYLAEQKDKNYSTYIDWAETRAGKMVYEHIGEVKFKYINLNTLKKEVKVAESTENFTRFPEPVIKNIQINALKEFVYAVLVDLNLRCEWTYGILNIEYNKNEIPKLGTIHKCEFEQGSFDIKMVHSSKSKESLELAERTENNFLFPRATTIFILKNKGVGSELQIELHYRRIPIIGKIIDKIFLPKFVDGISKSMSKLKDYCENNFVIKMQTQ